jgi:hypothetical protein
MSNFYVLENSKLELSPAMKHFVACIEAVIDEAFTANGHDADAARQYVRLHQKHFQKTVSKLDHAYHCHHPMWSAGASTGISGTNLEPKVVENDDKEEAERGEEEGLPIRSDVQQDQPTQRADIQDAYATGDDTPPRPSHIATVADVERDLEDFKAESGQRFGEMQDAVARLPRFPSAEKLVQGALSLGVSVEQLRECLLQMGAGRG